LVLPCKSTYAWKIVFHLNDEIASFKNHFLQSWLSFLFFQVAGYMPFSAEAYEKAKKDLASGLSVLEKQLEKKTYLVNDQITLADIVVASTLLYPFKLVCDKSYLKQFENVTRWFQTCVSQPEFMQVVGQVTMCKKEAMAPGQQ
jgi:elongation factor 1-gamma